MMLISAARMPLCVEDCHLTLGFECQLTGSQALKSPTLATENNSEQTFDHPLAERNALDGLSILRSNPK
jgi:hypothetical protein